MMKGSVNQYSFNLIFADTAFPLRPRVPPNERSAPGMALVTPLLRSKHCNEVAGHTRTQWERPAGCLVSVHGLRCASCSLYEEGLWPFPARRALPLLS